MGWCLPLSTPGHAHIKRNDYAGKLAKEAAQEATEKVNLPRVISFGDVKTASALGIKGI